MPYARCIYTSFIYLWPIHVQYKNNINILPFIYTHDVIYIYGIKGTENTCLVAKIIFIHTHTHTHTHIYTYTIINSII